ncbi:MAG: endonuclease/exonuclease/phosphatase family protein [Bacteroidota bacterium]
MKNNFTVVMIIVLLFSAAVQAQNNGKNKFMVANWNLENLFDTADDPEKDDAEFLPQSEKNWTPERLSQKFSNLARVISSMYDGSGPDILGVEEVENQNLLDTLNMHYLKNVIKDKQYKIAYAASPDTRGIDVGLLYNSNMFELIATNTDTVYLTEKYPTRLVLSAELRFNGNQSLYVIVNHWPSRRSGQRESELNRFSAASVVRHRVDKILSKDPEARIVITGDFNDEPENISLTDTLMAKKIECGYSKDTLSSRNLYNLAYVKSVSNEGSYFYKGEYNMLDQIIVSKNMLISNYICNSFEVYKPEFMKTRSGKFEGSAFPTYGGRNYLGGYSDHYPVTAVFEY